MRGFQTRVGQRPFHRLCEVLEARRFLSGAEVSGRTFFDQNANGIFDGEDLPYPNSKVYLDDDEDLFIDADERWTTSDAQGNFLLTDVSPGEHRVRWTIPRDYATPAMLAPDYRGLLIHVSVKDESPQVSDLQLGFVKTGSLLELSGPIRTQRFHDQNQDGIRQPSEPLLDSSGSGGFIDHNANGVDDGPGVDEPLGLYPGGGNVMTYNRYAIYPSAPAHSIVTTPVREVVLISPSNPRVDLLVGVVVPRMNVLNVVQNVDVALGSVEVQFDKPLYPGNGNLNRVEFRNAAGTLVSYNYSSLAAPNTYRFRPFPSTQTLPDGVYTMRIPGTVLAGSLTPPPDYHYTFTVLRGDLNIDGAVGFDDLLILAQNYGSGGRTYSQGNLTRDPSGRVDFDDLLLLAQAYGRVAVSQQAEVAVKRTGRSTVANTLLR